MSRLLFPARDIPKVMLLRFALKHGPSGVRDMSYAQLEYLGIDDVINEHPGADNDVVILSKAVAA